MAAFAISSMPSTPTAMPSTPGASRLLGYSSMSRMPAQVASKPGARHVAPTATSAGALAASPMVLAAPVPTLGLAAPSTLASASVRTVVSTALYPAMPSAPALIASGAPASIGTISVPQTAGTAFAHTPSWYEIQAELRQKVLRIVSYRAVAGAEAQLSDIMSEIEAQAGCVPGLVDFRGGMEGQDYTAIMIFQSQAALDKYRKMQRKQFSGKLKMVLEGPPEFDYQPPLATHIVKQPRGNGHVMSIVGYKCADGKEAEWRALYDDVMGQIENGVVPGLVVAVGAFLDEQAFMLGLVLESQTHLDSYKATVREQFLELMRPLLEDSEINELDNEVLCPLRFEIA